MARSSLKNVCRLIDAVSTELPPEQQFLNDLKRSIELDVDKNSGLPSKTYKPSGMNCMRASYYQVSGKEPDKASSNFALIGICNSGTDTHIRIQTAISKMRENGMDCEYVDVSKFVITRGLMDKLDIVSNKGMETKLYHRDLNMSFMCDGIVNYKGHYYILELKTESTYKFVSRQGVDPSHYNQATAYSLAFGIDEVLFVYINRDTFDMKSYVYNVTGQMKQDLIGYITECDEYVKLQVAPPIPKDISKKTCSYCMYKTQCKKDG